RVTNQDASHLARALHRRLQTLREAHVGDLLNKALARLVVRGLLVRRRRLARFDVEQRFLGRKRRHLGWKYASVGEELAHANRDVGTCQKCRERFDGNLIERFLCSRSNVAVRIIEKQNENRQLFVRTGRDRARCRKQSHVTRHLASFEKVEQRSRCRHGFATKFLRVSGVKRTVVMTPSAPRLRTRWPLMVTSMAEGSLTVSINSVSAVKDW